ncbi:rhomboid family intramembrane serine protease [Bartonella sp. F02]|uniref:rhomboid family intramembrane serine protease n=1 Tax=Bartonella sp. F02 TaxID=2967262 RepID=UPI0022A92FCD|nr:rhomboid family intramembrane serine protease [Bartonella sp. F02]MCZ2328610.1 rhomboid family intramembrane serine protease [Bartonella sp. F02]
MRNANLKHKSAPLSPIRFKEPLFNVPLIIVVLILFCFFIYFISQYFFSDQSYVKSLTFFSFVPVFFKTEPLVFSYTTVSYSFMHGSLEHVAINMAWLLVFGSPLAQRCGGLRFVFFWIFTAVISALTYYMFHQNSAVPLVGASGAISGMMGAIARYGFNPVFLNSNTQNKEKFIPLWSLKKVFSSKTTLTYIGLWFIINFITGLFPFLFKGESVSIAWEAHVGGLVSGLLFIGFFDTLWRQSKL